MPDIQRALRGAFVGVAPNTNTALRNATQVNPLVYGYAQRGLEYTEKVQAANPLLYLPLADRQKMIAFDASYYNHNGIYQNVTPGIGIGDSRMGAVFDGTGYIDISTVATTFNGNEWSIVVWAYNLGTGSAALRIVNIEVDTSNLIRIRYTPFTNGIVWQYTASGVAKSVTFVATLAIFHCFALTCSKSAGASGELKAYFDGVQVGTTQTALGTFVGVPALTTTVLGAGNTAAQMGWVGGIAHAELYNVALSATTVPMLMQI